MFQPKLGTGNSKNSLQSLTFGYNFKQSWKQMTTTNSLQTLTFGHRFNPAWSEGVLDEQSNGLDLFFNVV